MGLNKENVEKVTSKLIEAIERTGKLPWNRPWREVAGQMNLKTLRPYHGMNAWITLAQGFSSPYWLTFNQIKAMGGSVLQGSKSTSVVFWQVNTFKKKDASGNEEEKKAFLLKIYNVFNIEQTHGIKNLDAIIASADEKCSLKEHEAMPMAELVSSNYIGAQTSENFLRFGGNRAFYSPSFDFVQMPEKGAFHTPEGYYSTLFHELAHSTGHLSRLNRDLSGNFGDGSYSFEELVAEMASAMLRAECGFDNESMDTNTAAYVQSWVTKLKDAPEWIFKASKLAEKAATLIQSYSVVDNIIEVPKEEEEA